MIDIFDILGPIMVGPSSSHTAGAVRIGGMARSLLGGEPVRAEIGLHGSFAETGPGHGTDRALVAGLMGMKPDDLRIPRSFELAKKQGLEFSFHNVELKEAHPNSALLTVSDGEGRTLEMQAASTGGGRIRVDRLNGIAVNFTGAFNTLIIRSNDVPGKLAEVTRELEGPTMIGPRMSKISIMGCISPSVEKFLSAYHKFYQVASCFFRRIC